MFTPHHVSHVICHMSRVKCQVSFVRCIFFFFFYKVSELVGGGFVINRACPVQFLIYDNICEQLLSSVQCSQLYYSFSQCSLVQCSALHCSKVDFWTGLSSVYFSKSYVPILTVHCTPTLGFLTQPVQLRLFKEQSCY